MQKYIQKHGRRFLFAAGVGLFLKFLLIPTGSIFYELYHLTGWNPIYWGYSVFKGAGYYFGVWPYQTLACVLVVFIIATPWRRVVGAALSNEDR